ncbi:MAG: exosortase-associated EpsI family protein, partial [Gammaproteobacteria bacterium]|nr:exosortase-associated EpsI family protein [Gammaproteobacteria bacterium]
KWYLFQDGLIRQRTDGALIRLTSAVGPTEEWSDVDRRLHEFALLAVPALASFIPE